MFDPALSPAAGRAFSTAACRTSLGRWARGWQRTAAASLLGLATLAMVTSAQAQNEPAFPGQLIRIVPFGTAGGPIGTIARAYAEQLNKRWNTSVIVDAKPGASGILAADAVAKAKPDGHTVMITLSLSHINVPILHEKLPFDPVKDFQPLSQLAIGGPVLIAPASAPYSNMTELVEFARQKKGMSYGTWGNGSQAHLYGELLSRQHDLELLHVPYKGEANAHIDMLGGALDIAWANPATAMALAGDGRIKILGLAASKRLSILPEVSTFSEQGLSGFEMDSWIGAYAPAGTPQPVVDAWVEALREITHSPEVGELLTRMGFEALANTPDEFMVSYQRDYPRVAELIKAAGVTVQ